MNPESLPRSGGVRALEVRAADSARRTEGSPAPRRADAASDWPGRQKELAEQQRTRSAPAAPDERPRRADAEREPDAEPDQDADEAPGAKREEAAENENTRSWYQPPESSTYDPDPGFHILPQDIAPASQDHGFDQHPPEGEVRSRRDVWGDEVHPHSQDWRVRRSGKGQGLSQGSQHGVGSDAPAGSIASPMPVATTGRLFEKRSAPDAFIKQQQQVRRSRGPSAQQGLQGAPPAIAAQQQVRGANPPANDSKTAAQGQAISPYREATQDKMDEGRVTSSRNITEVKETPAPQPPRDADRTPKSSSKIDAIEQLMARLLLTRRDAYDRVKNGNMPLSTHELTVLMEVDFQRGLLANNDSNGMTFDELMNVADDFFFRYVDPDKTIHRGHEDFRGSGFALVEDRQPGFRNPFLDGMARGYTDPYFGWEINYNVVGQWLRIAGYSKIDAAHFLALWFARHPSKWKTLNLDRQTWFWIGYDYADARLKGWHPMPPASAAKPGK